MRGLTASEILWVWEWGRDRHAIDRALLALQAVDDSGEDLAGLSIGQRDFRLLGLHAATFGKAIEAVAECPSCQTALEFSVWIPDLMLPEGAESGNDPVEISHDGIHLALRAPDSRDLLEIADSPDISSARMLLLRRCIATARRGDAELSFTEIPASALEKASAAVAVRNAQADINLDLTCEACGRAGAIAFDIAAFFWGEIATRAKRLLMEVHALASAYGWSEAEILALNPARRRMYLEIAS